MHDKNFRTLLLNTQKALLGKIVPSLRGAAVDWDESTILMYIYNDGEISTDSENSYRLAGEEVLACYTDAHLNEKIVRLDFPSQLPKHEYWVYKRKEIR